MTASRRLLPLLFLGLVIFADTLMPESSGAAEPSPPPER